MFFYILIQCLYNICDFCFERLSLFAFFVMRVGDMRILSDIGFRASFKVTIQGEYVFDLQNCNTSIVRVCNLSEK